MTKMSDVLNSFIGYLIDERAKTYYTEEYDDILGVEDLNHEREEIIKDFLFKEFPNSYPDEINIGIQ